MTDINIEEIATNLAIEEELPSFDENTITFTIDGLCKFSHRLIAAVDKARAEQNQPVAWREVSCSNDGTCCYTYNEMGIGEPLFAAPTYKENEDE